MTQLDPSLSSSQVYQYPAPQTTCSAMLIAALLAIARKRKQHKCTLTDEWIKKIWDVCATEYYWDLNKNKINFHVYECTKKDYIEWGNPDSQRHMPHVLSYLWIYIFKLYPGMTSDSRILKENYEGTETGRTLERLIVGQRYYKKGNGKVVSALTKKAGRGLYRGTGWEEGYITQGCLKKP